MRWLRDFVENYNSSYSIWFARLEAELESMFSPGTQKPGSQRLAQLQGILAKLMVELDIDNALVKPGERKPLWAQPSRYPELPR